MFYRERKKEGYTTWREYCDIIAQATISLKGGKRRRKKDPQQEKEQEEKWKREG